MCQDSEGRFEAAGVSQEVEQEEEVLALVHGAQQLPLQRRLFAGCTFALDVADQPGH